MSTHAKLSPSSAYRWLECTASVKAIANADLPETTSAAAEEGSRAHELAEMCLAGKVDSIVPVGNYDDDMRAHVKDYIAYVKSFGFEIFLVEKRLPLFYSPKDKGTADVIGIKGNELHIIDLKYGQGNFVEVKNNPQLLIYAISALKLYSPLFKFDKVVTSVFQPRMNNIASWEYSIPALKTIELGMTEQARTTSTISAEYKPSEAVCKFCALKPTCKALDKHMTKVISADFSVLDEPVRIEEERMRLVLDNKKLIISWLKDIEAHVFDKLREGKDFSGYKIVVGRGSRTWARTDKLIEALQNEAYERVMLSPAKFEKLAKKNKLTKRQVESIKDDIIHVAGKDVLAPESDKRKPVEQIQFEKYDKEEK